MSLIEWGTHLVKQLRWITKDLEIYLQESSSEVRTGKPDSLSFALNDLRLVDVLKHVKTPLPFKPDRKLPEVVELGLKRGLSASVITSMSRRARADILQGTESVIGHLAHC